MHGFGVAEIRWYKNPLSKAEAKANRMGGEGGGNDPEAVSLGSFGPKNGVLHITLQVHREESDSSEPCNRGT